MLKNTAALTVFLLSFALFANVGVFDGSGQTPALVKTADIQMVEEVVVMHPSPGRYPIDLSCRNLDKMEFDCKFILRNLSGKSVTVPVGFPIAAERRFAKKDAEYLIDQYKFSVSCGNENYKISFVPYDTKKKFSEIFLWEMSFAPHEEKLLNVKYTVHGYFGMALAEKKTGDPGGEGFLPYKNEYLHFLSLGIGQMQQYITGTASSWAGRVEKATFRYYHTDFEKYLCERGAWHESNSDRKKRLGNLKKSDSVFDVWNPRMPMLCRWTPERVKWQKTVDERGVPCLELNYAPFIPDANGIIEFFYLHIGMPRNEEEFEAIFRSIKKDVDSSYANCLRIRKNKPDVYAKNIKYWERQHPYTPQVRKNVADAVLEFYGIDANNEEIKDFLNNQCWYPQKNPPHITEDFKKYLLEISKE